MPPRLSGQQLHKSRRRKQNKRQIRHLTTPIFNQKHRYNLQGFSCSFAFNGWSFVRGKCLWWGLVEWEETLSEVGKWGCTVMRQELLWKIGVDALLSTQLWWSKPRVGSASGGERSINPSRAATVPRCIKRHSASAAGGDSTFLQMREQTSAISNEHFLAMTYFLARSKFN